MAEPAHIRTAVVAVIMMTLGAAGTDAAYDPAVPRVRTHSGALAALINRATSESATFRRLRVALAGTDGLVYVEPGTCGSRIRACLLMTVTKSGAFRMLNIRVDPKRRDTDLMVAIAHELRHALEVLSDPRVSNAVEMWHFFRTVGTSIDGNFETAAAIETGAAVRQELRSFSRPPPGNAAVRP